MDYFSKFLRTSSQSSSRAPVDHEEEFHRSWNLIKKTLIQPDERQLTKGIASTEVPMHLQSLVDSLVWESTRTEEGGTGACLEYLLKNDVLGTLVRLSENDRPAGIQAEVLRAVQNMVVLMDEQFLVHSAVHRAVLRLLRDCIGDDLQEQIDTQAKAMGAARNAVRSPPSEHEEDLVNLLCILCSRIRTYHELLMIFFHDKNWYHSEPLFSSEEESEDDEDDEEDEYEIQSFNKSFGSATGDICPPSPTPSQATITQPSTAPRKPEYEFLLFNYLLRFVHREGQIGEFARAGLLFLLDVAMSPVDPKSPNQSTLHSSPNSNTDPMNDAALALAEYILDGDFSEVLGAGLSAVYSLLPSKLGFYPSTTPNMGSNTGMTIGDVVLESEEQKEKLEFEKDKNRVLGVEDASNPDVKLRLDHFLKLLEFLQDLLKRQDMHDSKESTTSPFGAAIVQSILDAVRSIFLENVLYPSILECSDTDGSGVAVMSYIEIMLRTLQQSPLSTLLVNFLVDEDNEDTRRRVKPHTITLSASTGGPSIRTDRRLKRRKSSAMMLLEMEAPDSRKQSGYFTSMGRFTLKDLLMSNLRSTSQAAVTSALQLLHTVLIHHPQLSLERILLAIPDPDATTFPHPALPPRSALSDDDDKNSVFSVANDVNSELDRYQPDTTYSTHERELGLYLALVSRIDPSHGADVFSTGYDHYLRDALNAVQTQPAYREAFDANNSSREWDRKSLKHRLNVNGPILSLVLKATQRFFMNTPALNMALTGVLATLSVHPHRSLAGWLTLAPGEAVSEFALHLTEGIGIGQLGKDKDDGDDRSIDFRIEEQLAREGKALPAARVDDATCPVLYAIFHELVSQLEQHRAEVADFDRFLLERRQGLLFSENLTDAMSLVLHPADNVLGQPTPSASPTPPLESALTPKAKPKSRVSVPSSLVSFLTPKKGRPAKAQEPVTPVRRTKEGSSGRALGASPFAPHYERTGAITVEPFIAPVSAASAWTPPKAGHWCAEEDDAFASSAWSDDPFVDDVAGDRVERERGRGGAVTGRSDRGVRVTLSQLLDNVVLLEESIKELVTIIHARRCLSIDALRFL